MTPDEIDALDDYTSAQHLKLWKRADIEVAQFGFSRSINGRTLTKTDAKEIRSQIEFWEARVADEASEDDDESNGGVALAVFGTPR